MYVKTCMHIPSSLDEVVCLTLSQMGTFGEKFKARRAALGTPSSPLSQEKVAQRAELSKQTIADYELNNRLPTPMNVPGLARALELDDDELWTWIREEVSSRWEALGTVTDAADVAEALEDLDEPHTRKDAPPSGKNDGPRRSPRRGGRPKPS